MLCILLLKILNTRPPNKRKDDGLKEEFFSTLDLLGMLTKSLVRKRFIEESRKGIVSMNHLTITIKDFLNTLVPKIQFQS